MTDEVLGYDCWGRALRAGDKAIIVDMNGLVAPDSVGEEVVIAGPPTPADKQVARGAGYDPRAMVRLEDGTGMHCKCLRRINSGRDIFEKARDLALHQGSPDYAEHTPERAIEAAMPWTEGDPSVDPALEAG